MKIHNMKTLKIYNIIACVIIGLLSWYCLYLFKKLNETNEVLQQCENAYYKETGLLPKN